MFNIYLKLIPIINKYKDVILEVKELDKKSKGSAKLRTIFKDKSFLDVWFSKSGKYSYHWERRAQTGEIYRYDKGLSYLVGI